MKSKGAFESNATFYTAHSTIEVEMVFLLCLYLCVRVYVVCITELR